jgi:beta-glucosidase
VIVDLVESGRVAEARIDASVRRLLRDKFRLGLFDQPYVDPEAAEAIVGNAGFRAAGEQAQRRSLVLLKNTAFAEGPLLPLRGTPKLYVENVAPEVASAYGHVVADAGEADVAIVRLAAPYETRDRYPFEHYFHAGDLRFPAERLTRILAILTAVPTVVDVYLDRPAVVPEIAAGCGALLASFGAGDAALLDVLFGRHVPSGKLPFELPSSMEAVRTQKPDVPYDSDDPLVPFGHGLTY